MNSPTKRVRDLRYPVGLKKKPRNALLSPMPLDPPDRAAVVRYERVASPVTRLQIDTPLFDRSPSPFETRRTISAASAGLLDTIRCWRSRSYQRKAGMPSLLPWRIRAWLAEVIDGSSASQRDSVWVSLRSQRAMVLTE